MVQNKNNILQARPPYEKLLFADSCHVSTDVHSYFLF